MPGHPEWGSHPSGGVPERGVRRPREVGGGPCMESSSSSSTGSVPGSSREEGGGLGMAVKRE